MELTASGIRNALSRYTESGIEYGPKYITVPHPFICPDGFMTIAMMMGHTERYAIEWAAKNGARIYKENDEWKSERCSE